MSKIFSFGRYLETNFEESFSTKIAKIICCQKFVNNIF